ncbi:MAG: hypothetical protein QM786_02865 [Breznakibacter sp.]
MKLSVIFSIVLVIAMGCTSRPKEFHVVKARKNALDTVWVEYTAKTVDRLPGYHPVHEPEKSEFGGWKIWQKQATGFFRTEKSDGRWWIIDPQGYPFIHKGVVAFNPGSSEKQKEAFCRLFQTNRRWADSEGRMLRSYGFNGTGAWSAVDVIREMENPLVYTIIVNPMGAYKHEHVKRFGGKYEKAGWQGYQFDLAMVFDPEFDDYVEKAIAPLEKYKDDKYLLGYFTDNELPWLNDALDRHLLFLGVKEPGYIAAQKWLDERKGFKATNNDITDEDRMAFTAFYFETYMKKVTGALRRADPNHMYLGCRFNQEKKQELTNPEIFKVAGKYMDIISINHYRRWEPDSALVSNWEIWSGKPFLVTEWYTKGEDSGLPNNTGAGWNVPSQRDRGYFYQNFAIELIKSQNCVGWHWFKYMDNDPENLATDPSNRDSNKGTVTSRYEPYMPMLEEMKELNDNVFGLIRYFDGK